MDRFGCDYLSELDWEAESCENCVFIIQMAGWEQGEETPGSSCQRVSSLQGQHLNSGGLFLQNRPQMEKR